jgi:WD40 repeat protein
MKHSAPVVYAAFSPDGRRVLTASADGRAWFWELPREDRSVPDCLLQAQLLTGHRLDASGGLIPLEPAAFRRIWQRLRAK